MPELRSLAALLLVAGSVSGCGLFGGNDDGGEAINVLDIEVGECFRAPTEVQAQIKELTRTDCTALHEQEAYALVAYDAPEDTFPGDEALTKFAEGSCAAEFGDYVGVNYLDSKLFFTYLVPSPRSWQEGDRKAACFVISPGTELTASVKGSKR